MAIEARRLAEDEMLPQCYRCLERAEVAVQQGEGSARLCRSHAAMLLGEERLLRVLTPAKKDKQA